jgi:hypothetical protein
MAAFPKISFIPIDRRNKQSIWLQEYRKNIKSQSGEDGVIEEIFNIVGTENKFCVDFGAGTGQNLSNSYNLIHNKNWSGLLLEPGYQFKELKELYKKRKDVVTLNDIVGFDHQNKLDTHIDTLPIAVPKDFDFLSIDIDGCDIYIWEDLKKYRPRVVCIEFNHFVPLDVYLLPPRDLSLNIGASLLATATHAENLGYELVATTSMNAFFVDAHLFPKFNIPDNSVEAMHFLGQNETKISHSYDGTLYLSGLKANPWKGFMIDHDRIQPLPSNMRQWKFDSKIWPQKKI